MLIIGHEEKDIQRAEPQHKGEENTQFFKALFLYVYFLLLRSVKYLQFDYSLRVFFDSFD